MCEWGTQTKILVPIDPDTTGKPFHWTERNVDSCLVPTLTALNASGIFTKNSCCGHGKGPGVIILHDGRELIIIPPDKPIFVASEKHDAWWTIHSHTIQEVLHRAFWGEDPEMLYLELIANSEKEEVEGDG